MPRPFRKRHIYHIPHVSCFGPTIMGRITQGNPVEIGLDELEALRLADYSGLSQEEASQLMGVSRPTFGRILNRARYKSSMALVNGLHITITGGKHIMAKRTFKCADCGHTFSAEYGTPRPSECPRCGSLNIHRIDSDRGTWLSTERGRGPCGKGNGRQRGRKP